MKPVYLDYNASAPIAPGVVAAMLPLIDGVFGNPSSRHWAGAPAKAALEAARAQTAALVGCASDEIVFTSGGTEADNLALAGVFFARGGRGGHIVVSAVEHPAVRAPCRFLERLGAEISVLPVDGEGRIDCDDLARAVRPDTILVSVMHANNEVGAIQPIAEAAAVARAHGVLFHVDAAQSAGKIATEVSSLGVDLMTLAGHKFSAPKGVGALYVRRGVELEPLLHGGDHEAGRRAGTESALLAAGLGAAAALACDLAPMERVRALRDALWELLRERFGARVVLNGGLRHCLPNTLSVSFPGEVGAEILARLDGVAASAGSACHAGRVALSPVLAAMGIAPQVGMGAVRFSLGRETTRDEIEDVAGRLGVVLRRAA
ncbi:cysteine desulfurase family protein [Methylocella sp.]|uniref:cysteine desulfurase family protein n=1 Tax=Methylocella sp. TaxID=1978226 RepID=UPI003784BDA8